MLPFLIARNEELSHRHQVYRRVDDRGRAQIHIPLRRADVLMAGEVLDRARCRATHREGRITRRRSCDAVTSVNPHREAVAQEQQIRRVFAMLLHTQDREATQLNSVQIDDRGGFQIRWRRRVLNCGDARSVDRAVRCERWRFA